MTILWEKICDQLNGQNMIYPMATYEDRLYAGTGYGGRLFRLNSTKDAWEQICGQLNSQTDILCLYVYEDRLYAGTSPGGRLFRLNIAKDAWEQVCGQLNGQDQIICMMEFEGVLYAGTGDSNGGRLFRLNSTKDAWVQVCARTWDPSTFSYQDYIQCLCVYDNRLYAGTYDGGNLFRLNTAKDAWESVCVYFESTKDITSLKIFGNRLYGSTGEYGKLFRLNNAKDGWEKICDEFNSQPYTYSLVNLYDVLYAGTYPDANLFKLNDTLDSWEQVCDQYGSLPYEGAYSVIAYQGDIYAGIFESGILLKADIPEPPPPPPPVENICEEHEEEQGIGLIDLKLTLDTHDLYWKKGDLSFTFGSCWLRQKIEVKLRFFYQEWFLDTSKGVDYYGMLFVKNPDINAIDNMIKITVLEIEEVLSMLSYQSSYNAALRTMNINFKVNSIYGEISYQKEFTV